MKRTISLLLIFALAAALCSCGTPEQEPEETRIDNYTYDEEKEIQEYLTTAMSVYGYNYSVYAREVDGKMSVSLHLKRAPGGAEETFADTVEWFVPVVEQAISVYSFEICEIKITFSLYNGSLDGDSCGAISYDMESITSGTLTNATSSENFAVIKNLTYTDVREKLCK